MLQIRTIINNEIKYLDLYGDEDIKLELSFAEVQDITKKNSVFTQSFKLPGSKNNNTIFNYFYDTNASVFDFDIKEKFEGQLLSNGEILYSGYLRLNSTTREKTEVVYDVTFYSQVGDLVSNIQEKYLSDLTLGSEYNVTGYPVNLEYQYLTTNDPDLDPSLSASTNPLENGKVYFTILNRGYRYTTDVATGEQTLNAGIIPRLAWQRPPADNDELDYWDSSAFGYGNLPPYRHVPRTYMTGNLRIKDLYEKVFSDNGYEVNSDFFNTAYFKRLYLPLTVSNENIYPIQSTIPQFEFGQTGATTATSVNFICNNYDWYEGPTFSSSIKSYRFNTSNVTVDNDSFYFYNDSFSLSRKGTYRFRLEYDVVSNDTGSYTFAIRNQTTIPYFSAYTSCWNSGTTEVQTSPLPIESGQELLNQVIEIDVDTWRQSGTNFYALDFKKNNNSDDIRITRMNVSILQAPAFISGNTYEPLKELVKPDIKQLDFISAINKMFNLVVIPDPDNQKRLIVEPIIDWIGKGVILDWSNKVDRDSPIKVQPLTTIINGTLDYNYAEDGASSNIEFKNLNDRKFGQNIQTLNTDYRDSVLTFDNVFSGPVDSTLNTESPLRGFTIPNYFAAKIENKDGTTFTQFNPYKTTPKLLFRSVPLPIVSLRPQNNWLSIDNRVTYNWTNNNRFTTYPFGASGLTHAIVWNKNDKFDSSEYDLSDYEDLYDIYYKDYIEDLIDPENRLVEASLYFDPYELRQLKFNEKIYLDGNYYRINKLKNYSLINGGMADVELVKLTREYNGHRVRYYDLINCTGGTDLHTSTDLNYGVYYLKGYNVSIAGDCYTISGGSYNSGYTYQALDLTSAYTDCNCNVSISVSGVDIYDEKSTGGVTPTPTPIPSGACETSCTYYEWENENPYSSYVIYKDCATGDIINSSVGASQIYTACTCDDYTIRRGGGLRENYTEDCTIIQPSPTPSITPNLTRTPTPTPSLTPNACYEYELENENPYFVNANYTSCCTQQSESISIGAYQTVFVCSTTEPTGSGFRINSEFLGCDTPCPSATPTVTPTITPTRTITPTPSTAALCESCYTYTVFNNGPDPLEYHYTRCSDQTLAYGIISQPGGFTAFCACQDSVIIDSGDGFTSQGSAC